MSNEQHPGLPVNPSDLRSGARGTGQRTISDLVLEVIATYPHELPPSLTAALIESIKAHAEAFGFRDVTIATVSSKQWKQES